MQAQAAAISRLEEEKVSASRHEKLEGQQAELGSHSVLLVLTFQRMPLMDAARAEVAVSGSDRVLHGRVRSGEEEEHKSNELAGSAKGHHQPAPTAPPRRLGEAWKRVCSTLNVDVAAINAASSAEQARVKPRPAPKVSCSADHACMRLSSAFADTVPRVCWLNSPARLLRQAPSPI